MSRIICLALLFSFNSYAETEFLDAGSCNPVFETLVKAELKQLPNKANNIVNQKYTADGTLTLDISSLKVCQVEDLAPGSYDILRQITMCADFKTNSGAVKPGEVEVLTAGDFFCTNEEFLKTVDAKLF